MNQSPDSQSQTPALVTGPTSPLLSIVVPYYNVEAYLADCLASLRDQLLDDIEVIMVDDGSADQSVTIAEQFAADDPRFKLVKQENQGLGPARNTGTRHARGTYLTFVDSDDLVAPRAYTHLVGSLEESESDFATGNAYRFSAGTVKQSWTHRDLFRQTRLRTTLGAYPALVADRMIWNKVFRRSFWDAGGYEFPAIRYEDYPVTIQAYLDAQAIDVVAHHVYFWRDRESGDSISQNKADPDNLADRANSAIRVLEVLAQHVEAHLEVEHRLHSYFVQVDLISLAEAMVLADPANRPAISADAVALADRLNPQWADLAPPLARMVHRALQQRNLSLVIDLARWRLGGDKRTLLKRVSRSGGPLIVPQVARAIARRRAARNPFRGRRLRVAATQVSWTTRGLELDLSITLRRQLAQLGQLRVSLPIPGGSIALSMERLGPHEVRAVLGLAELEMLDKDVVGNFRVDLRIGPLHWRGLVSFTEFSLPGCSLVGRRWVQPRGVGVHLGLEAKRSAVVLTSATLTGSGAISLVVAEPIAPSEEELAASLGNGLSASLGNGLSASLGNGLSASLGNGLSGSVETPAEPELAVVELQRPQPPGPLLLGSSQAPIEIGLDELLAGDVVDNIVTQNAFRTFVSPRERSDDELDQLRAQFRHASLAFRQRAAKRYGTHVFDQPLIMVEPDPIDRRPVWLAGSQASIALDDTRVLTRNWTGGFGLRTQLIVGASATAPLADAEPVVGLDSPGEPAGEDDQAGSADQ